MYIISIFNELLLLWRNGGYAAYHNIGRPLSLGDQRRIYWEIEEEFEIKWDIYYLKMTLAVSLYPRISKFFLLILGNYYLLRFVLINRGWVYQANYPTKSSIYEVYFRDNERDDLRPFLGHPECSIKRQKKSDIFNSFRHIRFHLTFKDLFLNRVSFLASKFKDLNLPETIILFEGRSLEYRSLYSYVRYFSRSTNVEFSWRYPTGGVLYEIADLYGQSNLDYPGRLHRNSYRKNKFVELAKKVYFDKDVLIVVPTFNSLEKILKWLRKTVSIIIAPRYFFSLHPSYQNLRSMLAEENYATIDESKSEYMNKYDTFIGCYSTLLLQAAEQGKAVMAIGYGHEQLEIMNASLSDLTIYDARALASACTGS